jgi:hypothetical protein
MYGLLLVPYRVYMSCTTHMYAKNFIFPCYTSATRVLHVYRVLEGQTHGSVNVPYVMYVCTTHIGGRYRTKHMYVVQCTHVCTLHVVPGTCIQMYLMKV